MSSLFKISNKIDNILASSGQKITQKKPKILKDFFCWYKDIWKFKPQELQIWYQWNLPIIVAA